MINNTNCCKLVIILFFILPSASLSLEFRKLKLVKYPEKILSNKILSRSISLNGISSSINTLDFPSQVVKIPTYLTNLSQLHQISLTLLYFVLHIQVLSQHAIPFPYELWPTSISSIGLDTLISLIFLGSAYIYHKINNFEIPRFFDVDSVPWRRPSHHPFKTFLLIGVLFIIFYATSYFASFVSIILNIIAIYLPLTIPMQRQVHLLTILTQFV